jgi:hypothetical protein
VTKQLYLFGPRSLEKAQRHIQNHPEKDLVLLRAPDRRLVVCRANKAPELRAKGFTLTDEV